MVARMIHYFSTRSSMYPKELVSIDASGPRPLVVATFPLHNATSLNQRLSMTPTMHSSKVPFTASTLSLLDNTIDTLCVFSPSEQTASVPVDRFHSR